MPSKEYNADNENYINFLKILLILSLKCKLQACIF
jgi:hypothetical protein